MGERKGGEMRSGVRGKRREKVRGKDGEGDEKRGEEEKKEEVGEGRGER